MAMGRSGNIFAHSYYIVPCEDGTYEIETALTAGNYPASGSYIDVSAYERVHVLIHLGSIDASDVPVFELKQADSTTGTLDTIDATYAKHTCAANDDGEFISFTLEVDKLAVDHHFISCVVSGVTNATYADIIFLGEALSLPVTQATATLPAASQHEFVG
jgi:hypothetical protein